MRPPSRHALLCAFCVACLSPATSLAYRTAADLSDFSGQTSIAFTDPRVSLELFKEMPVSITLEEAAAELRQAGETWSTPDCTDLVLSYSGTTDRPAKPGDQRNTVQWVDDWSARRLPEDSPAVTDVQYVRDDSERWYIAEADIYLNANFDWTTEIPVGDQRSLLAVLTHEVGHVIGLLHPCEVDGADGAPKCSASADYKQRQMYPLYSPRQTVLSYDDVAGVCFLYSPHCDDDTCGEGEVCVAGLCQALCGDRGCDQGFHCVDERCVPTFTDCGDEGCLGEQCTADYECDEGEFCDGRACARGRGALGDPCIAKEDCFDGACFDGACSKRCFSVGECPSSGECNAEAHACTDELKPMGASCAFSTDCRGDHCLAGSGSGAVCTRGCGGEEPECPADWVCTSVDGADVCTPQLQVEPAGGCAITSPVGSSTTFALFFASLSLALWRPRWRRRSSRTASCD